MKIVKAHSGCKTSYPKRCEECGIDFLYFGSQSKANRRRFCSLKCRNKGVTGDKNPVFKGGTKRPDGRIMISQGRNKRPVFLHRIVAEKMIGRKLKSNEVVHHKDGNPSNNDPSNLEICDSQGQHNNKHVTTYRDSTHKQCSRCLATKPRTEFSLNHKPGKHSPYFDPHDTRCKQCRAELKRLRYKDRKSLSTTPPPCREQGRSE